MEIERRPWGRVGAAEAHLFTLATAGGARLVLSDFGATAVALEAPSPSGEPADVLLGFDRVEDYLSTTAYFGATVGRFGNRIRRGRFELDGRRHQLRANEGANTLHGGPDGYDKRIWSAAPDPDRNAVAFGLVSPDGDQGFPGELRLTATYALTDEALRIEMSAVTDRPTLCNIVHHGYFNLAGHASGTVLDQELHVFGDFYTPVDEELVITGEVLEVEGTAFDFRAPRRIGEAIGRAPNEGFGRGEIGPRGYDHNFCLRGEPGRLRPVLVARDPASGRGFELHATEPGVQIYTGGYLDGTVVGKGGRPYQRFAGFTLETQKFPNAPNLSHAPQARLDPGETYEHVMEFRFLR